MLFRKSKKSADHAFPGTAALDSGYNAITRTAALGGATWIDSGVPEACGLALSGRRALALAGAHAVSETERLAPHRLLPLVVHLPCNEAADAAIDVSGHEAYYRQSDKGYFQFFARDVQEVQDLTLIAQRIAETALRPGIVGLDGPFTARAFQSFQQVEPELVTKYLGTPEDEIDAPTPAQEMLFGAQRRRIPCLLDPDRPAGSGARFGPERQQTYAGQALYFDGHLVMLIEQALQAFGELTGRVYDRVGAYRVDDAAYLVVAQGAIVPRLEALADYLRREKRIKLGVLNIRLLRPFPGGLISKLLKGFKGVTVLEQARPALEQELPIAAELRLCLDKALENSLSNAGALPYPNHAVYDKVKDRPALYAGIYGLDGSMPGDAELLAAVENMLPEGTGQRRYYLGVQFPQTPTRYPKLDLARQALYQAYPDLHRHALAVTRELGAEKADIHHIRMIVSDKYDPEALGETLARALHGQGYRQVYFAPEMQDGGKGQPRVLGMMFSRKATGWLYGPHLLDGQVASNSAYLHDLSLVKKNGFLLINSPLAPQPFWESLPEGVRVQIRERQLRLFVVDPVKVARKTAPMAGYRDQFTRIAFIGAFLRVAQNAAIEAADAVRDDFQQQILANLEMHSLVAEGSKAAFEAGAAAVETVTWDTLPAFVGLAPLEGDAPWTVQEVTKPESTVFDLPRLWDTVGLHYENNESDLLLTDPYLASGLLPARSSAFKDKAPIRSDMPRLIPERCSGCALCWTHCPDTALPASIQDFPGLIETGLALCKQDGNDPLQLSRISGHLGKQAYQIFSKDDLRQYRYLGDLLAEAFRQLLEKMNPKEDQAKALTEEFALLQEKVQDLPIVRTAVFFDNAHRQEKGSGKVLAIAVNPTACSGCATCVNICPEAALENVPQTEDLVAQYRRSWKVMMSLPELTFEQLRDVVTAEEPETMMRYLLRRKIYHTLPGGDEAFPGSGARTAIHLLLAAVEAEMQPRFETLQQQIGERISKLEARIQGKLDSAVKINDFDEFSKRLSRVEAGAAESGEVLALLNDKPGRAKIEKQHLKLLNEALSALKLLPVKYNELGAGGRTRMVLLLGNQGKFFWSSTYPYNPFAAPWMNYAGDNIAAASRGVFGGITAQMAETFRQLRKADLLLEDAYQPAQHDAMLNGLSWGDFSSDERAACPPVIAILDDVTLAGQQIGGLAEILSGTLPLKIAVINTLDDVVEASGKAALGWMALRYPNCFTLQSSPGYPGHLIAGVMEGIRFGGPALLHLQATEPHDHGVAKGYAPQQEKFAVDSRVFPLFKYNPAAGDHFIDRLSLEGNPAPEKDWVVRQYRVNEGPEQTDQWDLPFTCGDWAAREGRFHESFKPLKKKQWHDRMTLLSDYLKLDPAERQQREPFVYVFDHDRKALRVVVDESIVRLVESRRLQWRLLQEMAGIMSEGIEAPPNKWRDAFAAELASQKDALEQSFREAQESAEAEQWQRYHAQLTQKLLKICRMENADTLLSQFMRELNETGEER